MDEMIKDQVNKRNKSQKSKATKPKKSYHAYLEHPRMRTQNTLVNPKEKGDKDPIDPFSLRTRPNHKRTKS
jgi:hypothetical protein